MAIKEKEEVIAVDPNNANNSAIVAEETITPEQGQNPLTAYMRGLGPELAELSDEDAVQQAIERMTGYNSSMQEVSAIFENDPQARQLLEAIAREGSFMGGLLSVLTPEEYKAEWDAAQEGTPAFVSRQKRISAQEAQRAEEEGRLAQETQLEATISEWADERGISDEEVNDFFTKLQDFLGFNEITKDRLNQYWDMVNHDQLVQQAREDGVVDGKNQRIVKMRKKELDASDTPLPGEGGNGGEVKESKPIDPIDRLVARAAASQPY